jgi:hypothetical protein
MLKFPWGEETHFIEKLWAMQIKNDVHSLLLFDEYVNKANECGFWVSPFEYAPKLHTIRNSSDRFKVGQFVQPFTWTYKPYKKNPNPLISAQFDFMPPIKIVSKQRFDMDQYRGMNWVFIDKNPLSLDVMESSFYLNDGFNSVEHFFQYFNKPVKNMEIRHFTPLRY